MILTSEQTIRAVKSILEEQVLPALDTATWTASNVRACLLLLTYAEDCVQGERPLLVETNAAMITLFAHTLASRDLTWLDADLRASIEEAVACAEAAEEDIGLAELAASNMKNKEMLSGLIRRAAEMRTSPPSPADAQFRIELHHCLEVLARRDAQLTARARVMLPI